MTKAGAVQSPTATQGAEPLEQLESLFDSKAHIPEKGGSGALGEIPVGPIKDVSKKLDLDGDGKMEKIASAEALDRNGDGETDAVAYTLANGNKAIKEGVDLDGNGEMDGVRLTVEDKKTGKTHETLDADVDGDGTIDFSAARTTNKDGSSQTSLFLEGEDGVGGIAVDLEQDADGNPTSIATSEALDTDGNGLVDMTHNTYTDAEIQAEQTLFDGDEDGVNDAMMGSITMGGSTHEFMGADLDGDGAFNTEGEVIQTREDPTIRAREEEGRRTRRPGEPRPEPATEAV